MGLNSFKPAPAQDTKGTAASTTPVPRDPTRLNLTEPRELDYWAERLGVDAEELTAATLAVGTRLQRVEDYLRMRRWSESRSSTFGLPR
jgi:hypothetical protein